jgi:hypothetical protein
VGLADEGVGVRHSALILGWDLRRVNESASRAYPVELSGHGTPAKRERYTDPAAIFYFSQCLSALAVRPILLASRLSSGVVFSRFGTVFCAFPPSKAVLYRSKSVCL